MTLSWQRHVEENQVEDVFLPRALTAFLDEQIGAMRGTLREAGVTPAR